MKKHLIPFFALGLMLGACEPMPNSLIGTWRVDKVNVRFDENRVTPELVKQIGEMERGNALSISADSILVFKGADETLKGKLSLTGDSTMLVDGKVFGVWEKDRIITNTTSPLGEVVIYYNKE